MEEDTEYIKLPIEDRVQHKLWKARLHGYEEAKNLFSRIDDEKSQEWNKYLGLVKKFVVDSNVVAQEKGLEATLAFVENSAAAGKTVGEVMAGIVTKCISAPKAKTKDLAAQICLMYIEIEKHEAVLEELLKGTEHKNPKIVSGCVVIITQALREFGIKVVNVKPLVKRIPALLEDRDKSVRDEGKSMAIEIFRWIGPALKPQLSAVKPVQVTELEAEFEKVKSERAVPTRYLRSQQAKQAKAAEAMESADNEDNDECDDSPNPDVDPYELLDPVDILSKLPKDFYENVEAKKWQERKEALDALEHLLKSAPKLENGDYGDLVRALRKMITKDSNVVVVAFAGKCLTGIATGLKKRFQPYATACIGSLLEKFREKKQSVVTSLREAVDAIYVSTTLEAIQEDVLAALENKNPSVKAETASFLARCFTKCTPVILNKKLLKAFCAGLLKTLSEPDQTVRDASAEALGTAMKVVGEKAISPFLADVDNMKMIKIKEFCEKAELVVKQPKAGGGGSKPSGGQSGDRPATAPPKPAGSTAPKPVKRPSANSALKKVPSSSSLKKPASNNTAAKAKPTSAKPAEREFSQEEVDEKAETLFPTEMLNGLADSNWKLRLAAVEQFIQIVGTMDAAEVQTQVLLRVINKKPGVKDTNFQVAKLRIEAVKSIAENFPVSSTAANCVISDITEKLADAKTGSAAAEALTALSEATKLDSVCAQVLDYGFTQKNPKVQVEALNWLSNAIVEFGFVIQPKLVMEHVKKAVTAINPAVRSAAISFLGTLYVYMGPQLIMFFENEKPVLVQQINAEFEKHAGETPQSPIRGKKEKPSSNSTADAGGTGDAGDAGEAGGDEEERESTPVPNIQDMFPRVDISVHITDALVSELGDKNWKVRAEAVQKLQNIVTEVKFITNSLGEAPPVIAQRLVDSNSKIAASALALCQSLGTAMGPSCKQHVRAFFPGFLQGMGDSKTWIRSAAVSCINTWGDLCGYKEFFDGEMIADALKSGSPTLRSELWAWLAEKLPNIPPKSFPKEELTACIGSLFANLEDRNADVRKNASDAVLGIMMHVGFSPMASTCEKLKPGSQNVVKAVLEKARGNLPEKPVTKSKSSLNINSEKAGRNPSKMTAGSSATITKSKAKPGAVANANGKPTTGKKRDDDVDTSPLLQVNNLKNQRVIDEQKLKTLKWNFTTPREEFVELLKDQMIAANVNKGLIANMFHADFKYHLRAIEALSEDLSNNTASLTANLDLILRWMTLRFFDTNPSVLLKGLEYLQSVFAMLIEDGYMMHESEAASFIPYLILKVGDPKDTVRNNVKTLFKQIGAVYAISKLFTYVMEGLKSKNARQRTECLEQLGWLIESYGISVCQPTPAAALKEIARQISDRDNSVRNAALNCVVAAYFLEGDKVLKMVGQISDKDMSLLEERIKRAAKNRPVASVKPTLQAQPANRIQQNQQHRAPSPAPSSAPVQIQEPELREEEPAELPPIPRPRPVSGPYGLDLALLQSIESVPVQCSAPKLAEFDLNYLNEPSAHISTMPRLAVSPSPVSKLTQPVTLDWQLTQIANTDIEKALQAMAQIDNMLSADQHNILLQHEDFLVNQLVNQLVLLNQSSHPEIVNCYRTVFSLLNKLYNYPDLCKNVKEETIRRAIDQLISLLTEKRLEVFDRTEMFVRVVNSAIIRIFENSNHTSVVCALLKMLYDTVNNPAVSTRYQDLVMKCIWKVIKYFEQWDDDLEYDRILVDTHAFLRDFPSSWWKKQPSDTPLRTVKTVLHTMVKLRGPQIMDNVRSVRGAGPESELYTYAQKLLKHLKAIDITSGTEYRKEAPATPVKQRQLTKTTHDQLTEIFKKIGTQSETNEGLRMLYDFKQQHPEADIQPFLDKSSKFFRDYIERGLQAIDAERRTAGLNRNSVPVDPRDVMSSESEGSNFLHRLRVLQAKAGLKNVPASTSVIPSAPERQDCDPLPSCTTHSLEIGGSVGSRTQKLETNSNGVESLRQRLERLKDSAR